MTDPNLQVLEADVQAKTAEIANLEKTIQAMTLRVAALSDTAEQKRTEARQAFKDKFTKRFAGFDVSRALAGFPTGHKTVMGGVSYRLVVPNGESQRLVNNFVQDPTTKVADKVVDFAPVSLPEQRVLAWLAGLTMASNGVEKDRDLSKEPITTRLSLLRNLPAITIEKLAGECDNLETFLSVSLELELGNS
jgi:hypothetical protein